MNPNRERSRVNLRAMLVLVVTCCVACSGSSAQKKSDGTPTDSNGVSSGGSTTPRKSSSKREKLRFVDASPRAVSLIDFRGSRLAVGFSDGNISIADPKSGELRNAKVAEVFAVDAIAPHGDLALLAKTPPVIVNFEGDLILQMNTVPSYESATFSPDGLPLYVADKKGKVRIWGQTHSFEEDQHKERLEVYLNRQAPDFHVEFAPLRGPIHVMDDGRLVVVDQEGIVSLWDPTRPSSSKRIMKLEGTGRSLASAEGHIYATSTTGALKVGKADGGYLPWSKDARGDFVAASSLIPGAFFVQESGRLAKRETASGETGWEVAVPDGHPCGLEVSGDGSMLAACIGNFVVLFDADDGAARSYLYREADEVQWRSPGGQPQ